MKSRIQTEIDGIFKSLPQIEMKDLSDDVTRILTQKGRTIAVSALLFCKKDMV